MATFFVGAALPAAVMAWPHLAMAEIDCKTIPAGPDRTDCYIALGRINRQKSELSATIARQAADAATYRQVTGKRAKKTRRAPGPRGGQD